MERDYGAEIDEIKKDMADIKGLLGSLQLDRLKGARGKIDMSTPEAPGEPPFFAQGKRVQKMAKMHPYKQVSDMMERLCDVANEKDVSGAITYLGVFSSADRQSNWIKNEISVDDLLRLIEDRKAERVLECVGSNDRLNMLLALLRQPDTAAGLVERLGYGSTGQAYHHLKQLLAADIVFEEGKGVYAVRPYRIQGIIMLLAGISDILDPQYTQGAWEGR